MKDERLGWLIFVILSVFFGRFAMQGLSSDAAMYAGLSRSILENGHPWDPRALEMFPVFFEHPPYFFQWGAFVLNLFGTSDGAARAIGAMPGALSVLFLILWLWRRHSWDLAFWATILLLSLGHFTKYAATVMLEAPLSLGAVLFCVGTFEYFFRLKKFQSWLWLAALGAMIATASKGVVGFLFCAGLTPFVCFFSPKDFDHKKRVMMWFVVCGVFAALPLVLWSWMTWGNSEFSDAPSLLHRYLSEQVFRSYSTDRGRPELYSESWAWWTYPYVIIKYGSPWWWTFPLGAFWLYKISDYKESFLRLWAKLAVTFSLIVIAAFSTSHVRLPHYIHPIYIVLAPVGAFVLMNAFNRYGVKFAPKTGARLRWAMAWVLLLGMFFGFRGVTSTANRGQEFIKLSAQLENTKKECVVWIPDVEAELYRLESYFLWYLPGHKFKRIQNKEFLDSRNKFSEPVIWWSPQKESLLIHPSCKETTQSAS